MIELIDCSDTLLTYSCFYSVTLTGGDIEGFLLRAHRASGANDTEEIVGEFTSWPTGVKPLVWMPQSGVTYVSLLLLLSYSFDLILLMTTHNKNNCDYS